MLFIVLLLVLAALGLLVTALITALSLWAWASIGVSVLAALVLVADFFRRRAQRKRTDRPAEPAPAEAEPGEPVDSEEPAPPQPETTPAETGDPAEEPTAPADAGVVAQLDVEVVVVDEYPRYHVPECEWLADRDTIPIAVGEARDLGFTPCARCTPDAVLAQAHRATAR